jgi:hypothetical protein
MTDPWVKFNTDITPDHWRDDEWHNQLKELEHNRKEMLKYLKSLDDTIRIRVRTTKLSIGQAAEVYAEIGTWLEMHAEKDNDIYN